MVNHFSVQGLDVVKTFFFNSAQFSRFNHFLPRRISTKVEDLRHINQNHAYVWLNVFSQMFFIFCAIMDSDCLIVTGNHAQLLGSPGLIHATCLRLMILLRPPIHGYSRSVSRQVMRPLSEARCEV